MPFLEIACFSVQSAINAASHNATRIELCKDVSLGGTTPVLSDFQSLKSQLSTQIPINVMIRPRGGSFVYNQHDEWPIMQRELSSFLSDTVIPDGFVFGMLTSSGLIDEDKCTMLIQQAQGIPSTFHRAFDEIVEEKMEAQLEVLVKLGFKAVLTSGGKKSAMEGKEVLKKLVEAARGRIEIIVGGGVRSSNVEELKTVTGAQWFHSSAITDAESEYASPEEIGALAEILKS